MKTLIEIIRREMATNGILPFARFMELALYCPVYGYYETKRDNPGRHGDFYTNVSVGRLFGQLLAFQFATWLEELKNDATFNLQLSTFNLIEAGAHDGRLAEDILTWLQSCRPKLFWQIRYAIIEPSLQRQKWQKETLKNFAPHVCWFANFEDLKLKTQNSKLAGVVFSNELLDAMPVRRFGWDAAKKKWFEWGVASEGEKFIWVKIQKPKAGGQVPDSALGEALPDGYTVEISSAAENWWREAASILWHGRFMTVDYGFTADGMFSPSRVSGTLRAYFRHHASNDLLDNIGEQDLTAHVNFSAIQAAGESAGLKTEDFLTQAQFLTRILEKTLQDNTFGKWDASRARQFQTLTHPDHLGHAFRVLIQSRCNS
jgi:SAM-dependent MidA family methyltransferase